VLFNCTRKQSNKGPVKDASYTEYYDSRLRSIYSVYSARGHIRRSCTSWVECTWNFVSCTSGAYAYSWPPVLHSLIQRHGRLAYGVHVPTRFRTHRPIHMHDPVQRLYSSSVSLKTTQPNQQDCRRSLSRRLCSRKLVNYPIKLGPSVRRGFDSLVLLVGWILW
jgi:hypothetical protein